GESAGRITRGYLIEFLLGFGIAARLRQNTSQGEFDRGLARFRNFRLQLAALGDGFIKLSLRGKGFAELDLGLINEGGVGKLGDDLFERERRGGVVVQAALIE